MHNLRGNVSWLPELRVKELWLQGINSLHWYDWQQDAGLFLGEDGVLVESTGDGGWNTKLGEIQGEDQEVEAVKN
jgi:hypothetical protein